LCRCYQANIRSEVCNFSNGPEGATSDSPGRSPGKANETNSEALKERDIKIEAAFRALRSLRLAHFRTIATGQRISPPNTCFSATIRGVANSPGAARTEFYLFGAAWPSLSQPPLPRPHLRPGPFVPFAAKLPFHPAESTPNVQCSRPMSRALTGYARPAPWKPRSRNPSAKPGRNAAPNAPLRSMLAGKSASAATNSAAARGLCARRLRRRSCLLKCGRRLRRR
jgi:hypothetical protein